MSTPCNAIVFNAGGFTIKDMAGVMFKQNEKMNFYLGLNAKDVDDIRWGLKLQKRAQVGLVLNLLLLIYLYFYHG